MGEHISTYSSECKIRHAWHNCFSLTQGMGLVNTAFKPEDLQKLRNVNLGIGHTRYSTTGISELQNCQPFVVDTLHGKIAVAHNGELVNASALRKKVGFDS